MLKRTCCLHPVFTRSEGITLKCLQKKGSLLAIPSSVQYKTLFHTDSTANVFKPSNFSAATFPHIQSPRPFDLAHSVSTKRKVQKVGVVFDIDGVLVRGRKMIPCAQEALNKLHELNVPVIYLTNGGCETEEQKAHSLRQQLGVEV